jgi:hypothetical protein
MKETTDKKELSNETMDYQSELNKIFDEALKEVDSELLETLDFVSKLSTEDNSQMFHITTTHSGTIKQNNIYTE